MDENFRTRSSFETEVKSALTPELQTGAIRRGVVLFPDPLTGLISVVCLSVAALIVCSRFVDWNTLFVNGLGYTLNDQVGYVSVARNLVELGTLQSNIIYPSVLTQHITRNSLYMPGHYWVLAATYKLLGFSVAHSFLPSLLAFVVATSMIFLIAFRLYGASIAYRSCTFFVFFPVNLIYAFTAMAEMTLVAAVLVAFAVFVYLPPRLKLWVGPLLLVFPVLFRETGAAIAILMALMIFMEAKSRLKSTALSCGLMGVIVLLALRSPIAAGRPSLTRANILSGSIETVYTDAFAIQRLHPEVLDWVFAIAKKLKWNLEMLCIPHFAIGVLTPLDFFSLMFILSGIPIGLILWRRKRDGFNLGIACMLVTMIVFLLGCYSVMYFRGTRILLMAQPFVAVLWAVLTHKLLKPSRAGRWVAISATVVLAVSGIGETYKVFRSEPGINRQAAMDTAFLESIGHDDRRLLVSPYWVSSDYVAKHHPVRWSFVPANLETLKLLNERYRVGTVVLPVAGQVPGGAEKLQSSDVRRIGLIQEAEVSYRGVKFRIFKRYIYDCRVNLAVQPMIKPRRVVVRFHSW